MKRLSPSRSIAVLVALAAGPSGLAQTHRAVAGVSRDEFQKAYAAYQANEFTDAALQLEKLQQQAPSSFDVHELLGLTYAAQGSDAKAVDQLAIAVRISPKSVVARNNLATSLVRSRKLEEAEAQWRSALSLDAGDYQANRNLARLYLQQGHPDQAVPLLESARHSHPGAVEITYDLALAYETLGRFDQSRELVEGLSPQQRTGDVHRLLGLLDERQARYVDAVTEYSQAAHLDPSEENLFVWASELMTHRAYEPAAQVFEEGTRRYPSASRLWVGQGMALYARGDYKPSIEALLKATDLDAADPRAYLFLSKAYLSSPSQADQVIDRFHRYALLKPGDAMAQYYYAISLWKGRRVNTPEIDYPAVESLLRRSIAIDGSNAEVHLQLGILYNDQHKYDLARTEFESAVRLQPSLADAHFRLGRAYLRDGQKEKAQAELDRFKTQQEQHQAVIDKERAEVQQFVLATQDAASSGASPAAPPINSKP